MGVQLCFYGFTITLICVVQLPLAPHHIRVPAGACTTEYFVGLVQVPEVVWHWRGPLNFASLNATAPLTKAMMAVPVRNNLIFFIIFCF
jgi:hypothetical protein